MNGEHISQNPESPGLKGPGLLGPSLPPSDLQSSNPDYQAAKERYARQLEAILSTPLMPENFNTYAENALTSVVSMVEDMTRTYPGESLPLPRGAAEEYTTEYYAMDIDDVLDSLQAKVDVADRIKEFVNDIPEENAISVPPQPRLQSIQTGYGEYGKKETVPKLETILFFLEESYDLDINNPEEIRITKGGVKKDMMRKEPYYLVELPTLNRSILVCNETENITYVLDSTELGNQSMRPNELLSLDKSEIDQIITSNPNTGVRIRHTSKYIPKIELAIASIRNFASKTETGIDSDAAIVDESLLTKKLEKAPVGYMNIKEITTKLNIKKHIAFRTISRLGDELKPVSVKRSKGGGTPPRYYSEEDVEKIAELLKTPEGYKTVKDISAEMGVHEAKVRRCISELGDVLSPLEGRGTGKPRYFSPEEIEKIKEHWQKKVRNQS